LIRDFTFIASSAFLIFSAIRAEPPWRVGVFGTLEMPPKFGLVSYQSDVVETLRQH
jgi:hypothetical protein